MDFYIVLYGIHINVIQKLFYRLRIYENYDIIYKKNKGGQGCAG